MAVALNHHIVASTDPARSAAWWGEMLGLGEPVRFGPFWQLTTANDVNIDFGGMVSAESVTPHHYAFLVGEEDFDATFARIVERDIDYYADPGARQPGEINHHDGGRGVYFPDPDGHWLEIITRPYGGG
jgi:catechol 2,3-dioxygenase-like lactoylglutathione lyase family enzyme